MRCFLHPLFREKNNIFCEVRIITRTKQVILGDISAKSPFLPLVVPYCFTDTCQKSHVPTYHSSLRYLGGGGGELPVLYLDFIPIRRLIPVSFKRGTSVRYIMLSIFISWYETRRAIKGFYVSAL